MDIALTIAGVAVFAWLLIIVYRRDVGKQLPWFVRYVVWELAASCVQLGLLSVNRRWYFALYWWMEAIEVALIVAAVRESFLRLFEGFTSKPGFRWSLLSVFAGVLLYSAWKAIYAPPVGLNSVGAFIWGAEFTFRWGIVAIEVLTSVLMFLLHEPMNSREDAVLAGFGIASFTVVANVIIVSLFGTKYLFFSKYLPSVGYFAAAILWIRVFLRPPAEGVGFKELGMGPEDIAKELSRYRALGERIMGEEMVRLVVALSLPCILYLLFRVVRVYVDIKRPVPRALGTIIPTLRVVSVEEIRRFNVILEEEAVSLGQSHLAREVRWKQTCVNWAYLRQMLWNTRSFQQTIRFEILKIDPRKSSLEYVPHERLASELISEATAMREQLVRWQISLIWRAALGLTIDHETLMTLLNAYKQLEQEMVTLANMADNDVFHQMLIQRLGLDNWGVIEGGAEPA